MVIGITGSIACGKSEVLSYIQKKGYLVYSLDDISHELFQEQSINNLIKVAFAINKTEAVTRSEIGEIVFGNKEKREILNAILHPAILDRMKEIIQNHQGTIFIEVPLLYEFHLESYFDQVFFIYVNKETQLERLMKRNNGSREDAMKRINSQIDVEAKKQIALTFHHLIIDNSDTFDYTYKQIDDILSVIK